MTLEEAKNLKDGDTVVFNNAESKIFLNRADVGCLYLELDNGKIIAAPFADCSLLASFEMPVKDSAPLSLDEAFTYYAEKVSREKVDASLYTERFKKHYINLIQEALHHGLRRMLNI